MAAGIVVAHLYPASMVGLLVQVEINARFVVQAGATALAPYRKSACRCALLGALSIQPVSNLDARTTSPRPAINLCSLGC